MASVPDRSARGTYGVFIRKWFLAQVEHRVERTALFIVGVILTIASFFQSRTDVAKWMLVAGVFTTTVAVMFRGLGRLSASPTEGFTAEAPVPGEETAALAEQSPEEIDPAISADDDRPGARLMVAEAAIRVLLHPEAGPLAGCEFRLFRYDPDRQRLLAVIDPHHEDPDTSEGWAVGQGVTGEAWRSRSYVLATGSECWDGTFGLTAQQQERYRHLVAVAAAPVTNAAGSIIAVLSGSTSDPDSRLSSHQGMEAHLVLAAAAARILVDLLKWEADE